MGKTAPIDENAEKHAQPQPSGDSVIDVAAFTRANARVERNGAFENAQTRLESAIKKIGVELQIDLWVQTVHELAQRGIAAKLVGSTDICQGHGAEMFQFQHLAGEQVPIMHVNGQLCVAILKLFDNSAAVDDVRVGDVGEEFVQ